LTTHLAESDSNTVEIVGLHKHYDDYLATENLHEAVINDISETIRIRRNNHRHNVVLSLRAGKLLLEVIKPTIEHGHWQNWIVENATRIGYDSIGNDPVRLAQGDMQLWKTWKEHIPRLIEIGAISPMLDSSNPQLEEQLVQSMNDEHINISLAAMQTFVSKNVPEVAIDRAIIELVETKKLTSEDAKRIVAASTAIENLPDDMKSIGQTLYDKGLRNADIIKRLPDMISEHEEVVEEMILSGHLHVPGVGNGEGQQIPIRDISTTDVDIVTNRADIEQELTIIQETRSSLDAQKDRKQNFTYLESFQGTKEQIIHQLNQLMATNPDAIYEVSAFIKK